MAFLDELIVHIDPLPKKVVLEHGEVIVVFKDGRYYSMVRGKATRINLKLPIYGKTTGIKFDLLTGSHDVTLNDVVLPNSGTADGEPDKARVTVTVSARVSLNANETSIREWVEEFRLKRIDSGAALRQTFERTIRDYLRGVYYDEARQSQFDLDQLVKASAGTFLQIHGIDRLEAGTDQKVERARELKRDRGLAEAEERAKESRERVRLIEQLETGRQTGISPIIRDGDLFERSDRVLARRIEYENIVGVRKARLLEALINRLEDVRDLKELSQSDFVKQLLALDDKRADATTSAMRELTLPEVTEGGGAQAAGTTAARAILDDVAPVGAERNQGGRPDRWTRPSDLARDVHLDAVVSAVNEGLDIRGSCIAPAADPNSMGLDWAYVVTAVGGDRGYDDPTIHEMEHALGVDRVIFLADEPAGEALLKNWLSYLAGESLAAVRANGNNGSLSIEVEAGTYEPALAKALEAATPAVGRLLRLDEVTIELR